MQSGKDNGYVSVALYLRVSTDMQVQEGHSLGTQERLCLEYVESKLGKNVTRTEVFREEGRSGAHTVRQLRRGNEPVRQVLSDLIERACAGEFTHIVTYEVSRMSREYDDWVMIHKMLLEPAGVKVWVTSGDLDMDKEDDAFVGNILALVSDRERKLIRRRIMDARESRRQAGYLPGGHPPFGWRWEPRENLAQGQMRGIEPFPERAQWILFIKEKLTGEGWGVKRTARALCELRVESSPGRVAWTAQNVWTRIRNPIHAGLLPDKDGKLNRGAHYDKRLYDPADYQLILDTLAKRASLRTRTNSTQEYPLLGIVRCGHCGTRLHATRSDSGGRFYRCEPSQVGEGRECPGVMRSARVVEAKLGSLLAQFVTSPTLSRMIQEEAAQLLEGRQQEDQDRLAALKRKRDELDRRLRKLATAFTDDVVNPLQFQKLSGEWQQEYDTVQASVFRLESRLADGSGNRAALDRVGEALEKFATVWPSLPAERARDVLLQITEHITLSRDGTDLRLRLKVHFLPEVSAVIRQIRRGEKAPAGPRAFTDGQLRLLACMAEGRTVREAADHLGLLMGTAWAQLSRARVRTGITDTQELMAAALPLIEEQRDILDLAGKPPEAPCLTDRPLSPRRKQAWELHQKGVPYREIAQTMGCSPSAVNSYVHETRKQLGITREEVLQCMRERARKRYCGDDVLTPRQREAWELKQQGLMGKEIAERMGIYPSGVSIMLKEARKRLGEAGG